MAGTGPGTSAWVLAPLALAFGFFGIGWNGVQHTLMAELVGPARRGHRRRARARHLVVRRHHLPADLRPGRRAPRRLRRALGRARPRHGRHLVPPDPGAGRKNGDPVSRSLVLRLGRARRGLRHHHHVHRHALHARRLPQADRGLHGLGRSSVSAIALLNWIVMGLGSFAGGLSLRPLRHAPGGARRRRAPRARARSSPARSTALWQFYVTFGVLVGFGVSCFYVPLTVTAIRWFEHRRGHGRVRRLVGQRPRHAALSRRSPAGSSTTTTGARPSSILGDLALARGDPGGAPAEAGARLPRVAGLAGRRRPGLTPRASLDAPGPSGPSR